MTVEFICPTCGRVLQVADRELAPHRPFCSRRCQLLDLHKWFNEEYRISSPLPPPESAGEQPPPQHN
jgi:endogenous inhibitor of DNA gyrase (YacG/DUF329 family)